MGAWSLQKHISWTRRTGKTSMRLVATLFARFLHATACNELCLELCHLLEHGVIFQRDRKRRMIMKEAILGHLMRARRFSRRCTTSHGFVLRQSPRMISRWWVPPRAG